MRLLDHPHRLRHDRYDAAVVVVVLVLLLVVLLSACATLDGPSRVDEAADAAVVQADTDAQRKLRALGVMVIVSELMADRTRDDLGEAPVMLSHVDRFQHLAGRLREVDELWVETELYQVRESIYMAFGGAVRARVSFYLSQAVAPDAGALLARAQSALRYSAKGAAMLADVNRQFEALRAGTLAEDRLRAAFERRLVDNRARIERATAAGR